MELSRLGNRKFMFTIIFMGISLNLIFSLIFSLIFHKINIFFVVPKQFGSKMAYLWHRYFDYFQLSISRPWYLYYKSSEFWTNIFLLSKFRASTWTNTRISLSRKIFLCCCSCEYFASVWSLTGPLLTSRRCNSSNGTPCFTSIGLTRLFANNLITRHTGPVIRHRNPLYDTHDAFRKRLSGKGVATLRLRSSFNQNWYLRSFRANFLIWSRRGVEVWSSMNFSG